MSMVSIFVGGSMPPPSMATTLKLPPRIPLCVHLGKEMPKETVSRCWQRVYVCKLHKTTCTITSKRNASRWCEDCRKNGEGYLARE